MNLKYQKLQNVVWSRGVKHIEDTLQISER